MSTRDNSPGSDSNATNYEADDSSSDMTLSHSRKPDVEFQNIKKVGNYELHKIIGKGGMGLVYEATDTGLQRLVALKVLPHLVNLDGSRAQRFRNESRVVAQLSHPNIVPVFSVGECDGISFFAMHLVEGLNLSQVIRGIRKDLVSGKTSKATSLSNTKDSDDVLDTNAPKKTRRRQSTRVDAPVDTRVELSANDFSINAGRSQNSAKATRTVARIGQIVAEALQHAHDMGIIHRDIKPSNLMLDVYGKVWVTDFGLAQFVNAPSMTQAGNIVGTYRYMSPEQASGLKGIMDHRTDIYSLGVTLTELLLLRPLISAANQRDIMREIIYGPPVNLRKLAPSTPDDLAIILEKSMAKNPLERYSTASEMADDLNRFLRAQTITARRPNALKLAKNWIARNPSLVTTVAVASSVVMLLLLASSAAIYNAWKSEEGQRQLTEQALERSKGQLASNIAILERSNDPARSIALAKLGSESVPGPESALVLQRTLDITHEYGQSNPRNVVTGHVTYSPDGMFVSSCASAWLSESNGGVKSMPAMIHSSIDPTKPPQILDSGDHVVLAHYSPSGKYVVTSSKDINSNGRMPNKPPVIWDTRSWQQKRVLTDRLLERMTPASFHPKLERIVVCKANDAIIYDIENERDERQLIGHSQTVRYAEFSPDGKLVATISDDRTIRIWDSDTATEVREPIAWGTGNVSDISASFIASSDGIVVMEGATAKLYSVENGAANDQSANQPLRTISSTRTAVDRNRAQIGICDGIKVSVLNATTFEQICTLDLPPKTKTTSIRSIQFHPKQLRALVVSGNSAMIFHSETGELISQLMGHDQPIVGAALSDSSGIATVSNDKTLRLWRIESDLERRTFRPPVASSSATINPTLFSVGPNDRFIAISSPVTYKTSLIGTESDHRAFSSGAVTQGNIQADRLLLIDGQTVVVKSLKTSREDYRGEFSSPVTFRTQLVAEGKKILVHLMDSTVYLVDTKTRSRKQLGFRRETIADCYVSPDGTIITVSFVDGGFEGIDASSGRLLWSRENKWKFNDLCFSRDNKTIATIDIDGNVEVRNTDTGDLRTKFRVADAELNRIRFFDFDQGLVLWNAFANRELRCYRIAPGENLEFTTQEAFGNIKVDVHPSHRLIAIGGEYGALLWDGTKPGTVLTNSICSSVAFSEKYVGVATKSSDSAKSILGIFTLNGDSEQTIPLEFTPVRVSAEFASNQFILSQSSFVASGLDFHTGQSMFSSIAHRHPIEWLGFLQDNQLATLSPDGRVRVTDENGKQIYQLDLESRITAAFIHQTMSRIFVGTKKGEIVIVEPRDGSSSRLSEHASAVMSLSVTQDGLRAISVSGGEQPALWDLNQASSIRIPIENAVHAEISADGRYSLVYVGDKPNTYRIWLVDHSDNSTREVTQEGGTRLAKFLPNNRAMGLLSSVGDVEVVGIEDLQIKQTFRNPVRPVYYFGFSQDGRRIFLAHGESGSVWSIETGEKELYVDCELDTVPLQANYTPFSHDSNWILAGKRLIRKHPCDPVGWAESQYSRKLSEAELNRFQLNNSLPKSGLAN